MPTRKEQRLKKLIQAVPPEAPTPQFTARVMDDVRAVAEPEPAMDPALGALLRRNGLERLPNDFTRAVMNQVTADRSATPADAPIIPVRAGYWIAAVLTGLVAWAIASGSIVGPPREAMLWSYAIRGIVRAFSMGVQALPASYTLIIGAVSVLLGIEYGLKYGTSPGAARSRIAGQEPR